MKYVMFSDPRGDRVPILFVAPTKHSEIAERLKPAGYKVESAGFVEIVPTPGSGITTLRTFGRSESLQKDSNPNDAALISALHLGTVTLGKGT